jgi:hypothetical protein
VKGLPEKALRIHLGLVLAELICVSAFIFELNRARSGNTLSWAYVFEWPILGVYAIYVWRKLLRPDEDSASRMGEQSSDEISALEEYNRYLHEAHRSDGSRPTGE